MEYTILYCLIKKRAILVSAYLPGYLLYLPWSLLYVHSLATLLAHFEELICSFYHRGMLEKNLSTIMLAIAMTITLVIALTIMMTIALTVLLAHMFVCT